MRLPGDSSDAPVVIGMSCRFAPDIDSPEKLWEFLAKGRSCVSEMPEKRWRPYAASSPQATQIIRNTIRRGSFMEDIEGFDSEFFGVSPREAEFLDPQQRIMLELTWEALERAGVSPLSMGGTDAGVFMSANTNDYGRRLLEDISRTGAYAVNGTTFYGIANRISYFLDLHGPSVAVDTACAGSLTALHQACQNLRSGEVDIAIVGGINIMSTPALNVALDAAGAMSPDGRSKAFDKDADGYGRGEGAGVVVLKRAADARLSGDPMLALVMGGGVFQDGRSDGMMAPNYEAQAHMLREVYARSGIPAGTVDYVEAHGTGTTAGDGEEARALAQVIGAGRGQDRPCLLGSVKPNIGHVEGGSGIAGVLKTILAMRNREIPPNIHSTPNPDFPWETSGLRLVGELSPWTSGDHPRRAGVSSYGVGGTIAHVILEDPEPVSPPRATAESDVGGHERRRAVFPLSGIRDTHVRALADRIADWLDDNPDTSLESVGHTLSQRRSHLPQRSGIVAASAAELSERLRALANDQASPGVVTGRVPSGGHADGADQAVWVFSGHGAQWPGMGRQLLADEPEFAAAMNRLAAVFQDEMGWTPREMVAKGGPWNASDVQALTFAMQVSLAAVWRAHGLSPGAVIGHSVGEIAAAHVSGCLDLDEAARFACRRANALRRLEGKGGMAMVDLPFEEARDRLSERTDVVAAIWAAPTSTVISGDRDAVREVVERWAEEGVVAQHVDSDIAFHSHHSASVVDEVEAAARELSPRPPAVVLYSTAAEDPRTTAARDSGYWAANLCQPVRFTQAVEAAVADGSRIFLEVSSHPVVAHSMNETLEQLGASEEAVVDHSLRRDTPESENLLTNLAKLYCAGARMEWRTEHPEGELAGLPTMAWQHRPYWIFPDSADESGIGGGHAPENHLLLGGRMTVSGVPVRRLWQTHLDFPSRPYPQDHRVVGVEITPAASIINTFMAAAGTESGLVDFVLRTPLAVTPPRVVQVGKSENTLWLASRIAETGDMSDSDGAEHEWITHTTAVVDPGKTAPTGPMPVADIRARCEQERTWSDVDDMFRTKGVDGYAFPWDLDELCCNDGEQLAFLTLEQPPERYATSWAHVLDGALTISAALVTPADADKLWMSSYIGSVVYRGEPPARIVVHSQRSPVSPQDTVDVLIADKYGHLLCEVEGLRFAPLQDQLTAGAAPRDLVHELVWRTLHVVEEDTAGTPVENVVFVGDDAAVAPLATQFERAGVPCVTVSEPDDLTSETLLRPGAVIAAPASLHDGETPEEAAERCTWSLIRTAQQLVSATTEHPEGPVPRFWCLTRGVRDADEDAALGHAPLWGVSRVIAGEHSNLWGGVIDLSEVASGTADQMLRVMESAAGEDVISVSEREVAVARLNPIERAADSAGHACYPSGTYLITGGLGALGFEVAQWLVNRGARRLLLVGRRGLPPRSEWDSVRGPQLRRQIDGVLALEANGATVKVLALDVTDADQVSAALEPSTHGMPPVRGIVHAAGVTRDATLDKTDRQGLQNVLSPKVRGAMVLHRIFPPGSLDFFVLFSSCGQFARLTGQTSYAAANSFLDALATHRRAGGHKDTVTLGWTSWRGAGMSESIDSTMLEANARGLEAVSVNEALRAWTFAENFDSPYQAILRVLPLPPNTPRLPMFRELKASEADMGDSADQGPSISEWLSLPDEELCDLVTTEVCKHVATELHMPAEDVDVKRPLVEIGVDSVMAVALRVRLQRQFGLDLPTTILWSKPTVSALGQHVAEGIRVSFEEAVV